MEESIWEAARIKNVVFERQPTQMEAQYRRLVQKLGGVKQALETIINRDVDFIFYYFNLGNPKINNDRSRRKCF